MIYIRKVSQKRGYRSVSPSLLYVIAKTHHRIGFRALPGGGTESICQPMTVSLMFAEAGLLTFVACGAQTQSDTVLCFRLCSGTYCFWSGPEPN